MSVDRDRRNEFQMVPPGSARSQGAFDQLPQPNLDKQSKFSTKCIVITVAVIVVGLLVLAIFLVCSMKNDSSEKVNPYKLSQTQGIQVSATEQFRFQIFCPINSLTDHTVIDTQGDVYFQTVLKEAKALSKEMEDDGIDRYVIYTQRRNVSEKNNSDYLFYCSFATDWFTRDCSQAKAVCNTPGPIFYIEQNKTIDVAWVYNIKDSDQRFATLITGICYTPFAKAALAAGNPIPNCITMKKKYGKPTCTYESPTKLEPKDTFTKDFYITTNNVPTDVHIHGLQVRPTFDGNPESFMGKDGQVGLGYQSLTQSSYFSHFKRKITTTLKQDPSAKNLYVKVNRYENVQPPGNLWYHDHSMRSTMSNVVLGLAGDYIIHKPQTDSKLPSKEYQILIVAGQNFKDFSSTENRGGAGQLPFALPFGGNRRLQPGSGRGPRSGNGPRLPPPPQFSSLNPSGGMSQSGSQAGRTPGSGSKSGGGRGNRNGQGSGKNHFLRFNPQEVPLVVQNDLVFQRNQTYRIRILNAQFDSVFTNLQFKSQCNETSNDPASCKKILNYSIIGSDSSLFDKPVHNVDSITLASAQRFQLLIIFDGDDGNGKVENEINAESSYVLIVSGNQQVKNTIPLATKDKTTSNKYGKFPTQVKDINGVTFYDLNQIDKKCDPNNLPQDTTMCIDTIRMRPIMMTGLVNFFFNGHYQYSSSGRTDNSKIGTTEDWIFINTMTNPNAAHPIHIHLINYQVIASTFLKTYTMPESNQNQEQSQGDSGAQRLPPPPPPNQQGQGQEGQQNPLSAFQRTFGQLLGGQGATECSLYLIDYYIEAGVLQNSDNLTLLCQKLGQISITDKKTADLLRDKFPQDEKNPDTLVSGFDVFTKYDPNNEAEKKRYHDPACPDSEYKYVCGPLSKDAIPDWYKKWKEVVLVNPKVVMQVRTRWTSTEYNTPYMPNPYPYFHIPEDEIIQFPGYVYHCHFLQHEDNELMRSIMMQPSDKFAENYKVKGTPLGDCMQKKGLKNKDGWKARYQCINELTGCSSTPKT